METTSDWILPTFEDETTNPQTVNEEIKRLQTLKSYLVLDSKCEEAFDRITQLASRIFDVPLSMVTLIDLGRQYLMSSHGLSNFGLNEEDTRDVPRKLAFCSRKSNSLLFSFIYIYINLMYLMLTF